MFLLLTFKCVQGCAPLYLRELLVKQANTRTLRSNTKNLLQIPLTNLKRFGDRAFCAYAPRLWNELPDNIKAADSVQNFRKQLKTLLFRKEFNLLYAGARTKQKLLLQTFEHDFMITKITSKSITSPDNNCQGDLKM